MCTEATLPPICPAQLFLNLPPSKIPSISSLTHGRNDCSSHPSIDLLIHNGFFFCKSVQSSSVHIRLLPLNSTQISRPQHSSIWPKSSDSSSERVSIPYCPRTPRNAAITIRSLSDLGKSSECVDDTWQQCPCHQVSQNSAPFLVIVCHSVIKSILLFLIPSISHPTHTCPGGLLFPRLPNNRSGGTRLIFECLS